FSPGGRRFASAGDRFVQVWDCRTWEPLRFRMKSPGLLTDLAYSPDGQRLAGISRDMVKLWDAQTGQELLTLRGAPQRHRDPAFNRRLAFSPDGTGLAGTNWDESVSLWAAPVLADEAARGGWQQARRRAAEARAPLWHLQEAEHCLEAPDPRARNAQAARFHLGQVDGARLSELLCLRKAALERRLEESSRKGPATSP